MRLLAHRALVDATRLHYAQSHRGYHDVGHLDELIALAHEHAPDLDEAEQLALLFHDAVYVPGAPRGDNERLSGLLMRATVRTLGLKDLELDRAARIIDATTHAAPPPAEAARVCDLDFGGSPRRGRRSNGMRSASAANICICSPTRPDSGRRAMPSTGPCSPSRACSRRTTLSNTSRKPPAPTCVGLSRATSSALRRFALRSAYAASIMSIWPVISGEVGLTLLGHEPTSLPFLSIRYLWKFHLGIAASPASLEIHW
jgi:hypothetical protein